MNLKYELCGGERIQDAARKAKMIAKSRNETVEFEFNGVTCVVGPATIEDCLVRHYMDAHIMEWKTIGPDFPLDYDEDTKIELYTRRLEQAKRQKKANEEYRKKELAERAAVEAKIHGVILLIHSDKQSEYESYVVKNSNDGYSRAVIEYAETWAKLMQIEIARGRTVIKDIADECQKDLGYLGITGFQYGCVVSALSHFWVFGEELRRWHNKEYGVSEDKKGVINPAIMTINLTD